MARPVEVVRDRVPGEDDDGQVKPTTWRDRIAPVTAEWMDTPPPPREWLLRDNRAAGEGYLGRGTVGLLVAEGGAGKTQAEVQLAMAVATATPWLGTFVPTRPGRSLLLLAEEDLLEARRRIHRSADGKRPPDGAIVIGGLSGVNCTLLVGERGDTAETPFVEELRRYLVESGPYDLVTFDPLSRWGGAAETDNHTATELIRIAESFAESTGATIIIAHHTPKAARGSRATAAATARGVSALSDGARWVAAMEEREDGLIQFKATKSNNAPKGQPLLLRWAAGGRLDLVDAAESPALDKRDQERQRKLAERDAEAAAKREATNERKAADKAQAAQEREAAATALRQREDAALREILIAQPGIPVHALRTALAVVLGACGRQRGDVIIARAGAAVATRHPGGKAPQNALGHFWAGTL